MRPAYLLPAAALLLGPAPARGEPPPRVSVRLEYQRGPGGAACPAEETLRDEVARRMGYDPFDPGAAGRLVVVVAWQARRFEAQVDRYTPGGEKTWSEVYPGGARCALMFPSLASEISAVLEPAPPPLRATPPPSPHAGAACRSSSARGCARAAHRARAARGRASEAGRIRRAGGDRPCHRVRGGGGRARRG